MIKSRPFRPAFSFATRSLEIWLPVCEKAAAIRLDCVSMKKLDELLVQ